MMEWETIPQMLNSGALRNVRQLDVEFHITDIFQQPKKVVEDTLKKHYTQGLSVLRMLYDAGYRTYLSNKNIFTIKTKMGLEPFTKCQEMSFIKV